MSDEIRIEMMRRKVDGTKLDGGQSFPFVIYPSGDSTMEIVSAYDYFLQAFCEVRPYARTEVSRLRDACKEFFEKHGCHEFSKYSLGNACIRNEIKLINRRTVGFALVSLFGELSPIEKAINFIHSREGETFADDLPLPRGGHSHVPWATSKRWCEGKERALILRETVPPPIVPDGPR